MTKEAVLTSRLLNIIATLVLVAPIPLVKLLRVSFQFL